MKHYLKLKLRWFVSVILTILSQPMYASLISYFKDEQGRTNWQYVANWSSGILIILLSITAVVLFFSRRQVSQSNQALKQVNDELEQRVADRTATLDESNQKLIEANELLEGEIEKHLQTTKQLQASETYIKNILESMPIMLVGLNQKQEITQWNQAAERLTGIEAKDALGKELWTAYPTLPLTPDRIEEAINNQTVVNVRSSQRGQLHFEITIYPLENYIETGLVILVDDVTHQVQSENKLIQKDKMSAMGEMSSIMAYDISPPLKSISEELGQIQSSCPDDITEMNPEKYENIRASIAVLNQQSQRASAIVTNLLEFSGASPDALNKHNMIEIIEHSLELSRDIFTFSKGLAFDDIHIERHYEENLPDIPCFQSEMQQVFVSLFRYCLYALRHVERDEHSPQVSIQVLTSYDSLWIKVQHNGLGINLDEQQVIFEPYFSDDALTTEQQYEASKRLSFPYFIVTQHHQGNMAVTSNVDIGTTFHIELSL